MNEVLFKSYCLRYVRYSAILEHLKSTDAGIDQMSIVVKELEKIRVCMLKELEE